MEPVKKRIFIQKSGRLCPDISPAFVVIPSKSEMGRGKMNIDAFGDQFPNIIACRKIFYPFCGNTEDSGFIAIVERARQGVFHL